MNIYEKLAGIQQELKAPKDSYNDFGKYKYRSAESILEALKPLLDQYKVLILLDDTLENIGERYYIKATAKLIDLEFKDGQVISIGVSAYAREEETKKGMDGSQITGTSSSYARKYALNGMFAIDDTKDSDYTNKHEDKPTTKALSEGQVKRLYAIGYAAGLDANKINDQVKTKFNKEVKDLTKEEYDKVCEGYEKLKK